MDTSERRAIGRAELLKFSEVDPVEEPGTDDDLVDLLVLHEQAHLPIASDDRVSQQPGTMLPAVIIGET